MIMSGIVKLSDDGKVVKYVLEEDALHITIPEGAEVIGVGALSGSKSLQSIDLPKSLIRIEEYAFLSCHSLKSITIPDSVTVIERYAFANCDSLQSFDIPASVREIDSRVFDHCFALQSINVAEGNQHFASIDGVLFNRERTVLIKYPTGRPDEQYRIPDGVKVIGDSAFSECRSLQRVEIPDSVTTIENSAFSGCALLQSIVLPEGVTTVMEWAFSFCDSMQSIVIPASITEIEEFALQSCYLLKSIHCRSRDLEGLKIDSTVFGEYPCGCTLYVPTGTADAYKAHPAFEDFKQIVEE